MEKTKYTEVVSAVIDEGKYYNDAMDWYALTYFNIIVERTFFILLSIFSFIIVVFLYLTIQSILPLKEKFPVLIRQKDTINFVGNIKALKPIDIEYTSSEAILRFLLIEYAREVLSHNYKNGNIEELNNKINKIQSYSSIELGNDFKKMINSLAEKMFNKNIEQKVTIQNFKFLKNDTIKKQNIFNKIKNYFFEKIPTEVEMSCIVDTIINSELDSTKMQKIILNFIYEPVIYSNIKNEFSKPNLIISNFRSVDEKVK